MSKFKLIHALYDEHDSLMIEHALEYLKTINLWTDIAELTLDIAHYYKKMVMYTMRLDTLKSLIMQETKFLKERRS